jgi:hypothetical protein
MSFYKGYTSITMLNGNLIGVSIQTDIGTGAKGEYGLYRDCATRRFASGFFMNHSPPSP